MATVRIVLDDDQNVDFQNAEVEQLVDAIRVHRDGRTLGEFKRRDMKRWYIDESN